MVLSLHCPGHQRKPGLHLAERQVTAAGGQLFNNQTTNQTGANFNVTSGATTSVTGTIRALASQTADLLQFQNQRWCSL